MKLAIFGKPFSGKGTFANMIARDFGLKHISAGDIFREHHEKFKKYLDKGELIPDDIVIKVVKEKLKGVNNFILDGFPRTLNQAKNCGINFDKAIFLNVTDETVLLRAVGRRTCSKCGEIFNVNTETAPKQKGICDKCGGKLIIRDDDLNIEIPKKRISIYNKETAPVVEFYKDILIEIDGNRSLNAIYEDIKKVLKD